MQAGNGGDVVTEFKAGDRVQDPDRRPGTVVANRPGELLVYVDDYGVCRCNPGELTVVAPALSAEDAAVIRAAVEYEASTGRNADANQRALFFAVRARTQEPAMPEVQGAPGPEIAGLERAVVGAADYWRTTLYGEYPEDCTWEHDAFRAMVAAIDALTAARTPPVVDRVAELREAVGAFLSHVDRGPTLNEEAARVVDPMRRALAAIKQGTI